VLDDLRSLWDRIVPLQFDWLQVEVSARCNAACGYCALSCYRQAWQEGVMDLDTFARLEPYFPRAGMVFLQGWGEPLLHPRFWSLVRRVKSSGTRVGFTTNGTLLADRNLELLLETEVDMIGVSLAGGRAATHERFRRGCGFRRISAGLEALRRRKEAVGQYRPSVHIAFMILRSNWRELDELITRAVEWGVSQVVVNNLSLIATESLADESLMVNAALWPRVQMSLEQVREIAAVNGIHFDYYSPDTSSPQPICTENVLRSCFISRNGDVSPCVMTNLSVQPSSPLEQRFGTRSCTLSNCVFGNVNQQSLVEIWHDAAARRFRAAFEKRLRVKNPGVRHLPDPCRHCYKLFEHLNTATA
jgi:MoaA/NifB/PqqE/SkfB family radical SAM enzyme